MSKLELYSIQSKTVQLAQTNWQLDFYSQWENFLFENDQIIKALFDVNSLIATKKIDRDFRIDVEMGSVQYLLGVFPKEKVLRLCTKQLSNELTLLRFYESLAMKHAKYDALNAHVESVALIPLTQSPLMIERVAAQYDLVDLAEADFDSVNKKAQELTDELLSHVRSYKVTLFEKVSDFGLGLTANYMLVRIHLLKFLAILPTLDHDKNGTEVKKNFLESLERLIADSIVAKNKNLKEQKRALPDSYVKACKLAKFLAQLCPARPLALVIRKSVGVMAQRFIAGENIVKAQRSMSELLSSGRDATLDQLGELVVSNLEADAYMNKVIEIIQGLEQHIPRGTKNAAGILKAHVSIKVSALSNDFRPHAYEYTYGLVAPRLLRILLEAKKHQVFVNIDAEHYHYRDLVFKIYSQVLSDNTSLHDYADTGIVVQAYLRDAVSHLQEVIVLAQKRKIRMPIRLVKGAYWDAETIEAEAHNYNAPQFLNKEETDIHFRQMVYKVLGCEHLQLALASHNIQDHCFALALREVKFPDAPVVEHQCLHMTYEALSFGLAKLGLPTRNYIPIGDLLVGMAYLVRRIMENSSQVGILTIMRSHKKNLSFISPVLELRNKVEANAYVYDLSLSHLGRDFRNIYPIRTYIREHFEKTQKTFKNYHASLRSLVRATKGSIVSSSEPQLLVGTFTEDTAVSVNQKIEELFAGYLAKEWSDNRSLYRFESLLRLGEILVEKRELLTAEIMVEAGKTLLEAIADVDEAVDFINFYVREQIEIQIAHPDLAAKGVIGVIAPWNFPLAIPCGMAIASLVAGNSVILKPAEQTPLIAKHLIEMAYAAGIPQNVFQIAIGEAAVGQAIVAHELINGIVFTGSKAVGTKIYEQIKGNMTSKRYPFAPVAKTAITEMGGKNAIIVTNNSELDETVSGIIYSAFAHAGQKCSAASRIIIDEEIKDAFVTRFVEAVNDLTIGKSYDHSTMINPLISKEDQERVRKMAKEASEEVKRFGGQVLLDRTQENAPGYCVGPAIFEIPKKDALNPETVACREVFGPIVHIIPYKTLDEAIEIFNGTQYALTGGIFAQSQDDIDYLCDKMEVGNIYINRPNTGARVAIEPFGGFKMSGTGPKAGSRDYLWKFSRLTSTNETRSVFSENLAKAEIVLPYNSGLNSYKRCQLVLRFLEQFLAQFEEHAGEINETHKEEISKLQTYIQMENLDLGVREFPNRFIPGQINFDKKNMGAGQSLMLLGSDVFDLEMFTYFCLNLVVGNGITVACTNEQTSALWMPICDLAKSNGLSELNLNCTLIGRNQLDEVLAMEYRLVIFDNASEAAETLLTKSLSYHFEHFLRRVILAGEVSYDWERMVCDLTTSRSFAINTMRHGAPLDISL